MFKNPTNSHELFSHSLDYCPKKHHSRGRDTVERLGCVTGTLRSFFFFWKAFKLMMYRGLMILNESREKYCNQTGSYSTEFLQTSLDGVTWIAKRFNQKIGQVDIDALSPFPSHSVYMSALQQDRMWRETGDLRCFEATNSMASMLRHFGRRWLNASKSLLWSIFGNS